MFSKKPIGVVKCFPKSRYASLNVFQKADRCREMFSKKPIGVVKCFPKSRGRGFLRNSKSELSGPSKVTKSELGENHDVCYLTKAVKMRDFSGLLDPGPKKRVMWSPPRSQNNHAFCHVSAIQDRSVSIIFNTQYFGDFKLGPNLCVGVPHAEP